ASEMLCCDQKVKRCVVTNDLFEIFECSFRIPSVSWPQFDGQDIRFVFVAELCEPYPESWTEDIEPCRLSVESQRPSVSPSKISKRFKVVFVFDNSNRFLPKLESVHFASSSKRRQGVGGTAPCTT